MAALPAVEAAAVQRSGADIQDTRIIVDGKLATEAIKLAWSQDETEDIAESPGHRSRWLPIGLLCAAGVALAGVSAVYFAEHKPTPSTAPIQQSAPAPISTHTPMAVPPPTPVASAPVTPAPVAPPPTLEAVPPAVTAIPPSAITQEQANTICRWLRDPAWTMPQIETSTGDMLANNNPNFREADVFKAISAAMSTTCPEVSRSFD